METVETVEEVDRTLRRLSTAIGEENGDLAVAIDQIVDAIQEADDGGDADEIVEDITLPFYEEERKDAFLIGITVGGLAELREHIKEEPNVDVEDLPDEGGQQIEAEQSQTLRA